jgi:hypothetical protein
VEGQEFGVIGGMELVSDGVVDEGGGLWGDSEHSGRLQPNQMGRELGKTSYTWTGGWRDNEQVNINDISTNSTCLSDTVSKES